MSNIDNDIVNNIVSVLEKNKDGLTMTELAKLTNISRFNIRVNLARLEGAKKVSIRKIGMAKIYSLKKRNNVNKKTTKKQKND